MVDGVLEIDFDGVTHRIGKGQFVLLPHGVPHAIRSRLHPAPRSHPGLLAGRLGVRGGGPHRASRRGEPRRPLQRRGTQPLHPPLPRRLRGERMTREAAVPARGARGVASAHADRRTSAGA
ncbi:cupin domain-containing protein [Microbispora sitophila]|uniref:hypothetical protein n=1 Tax=Microbispora sitophila TaxID=2771537 RepID=UPI00384B9E07